MANAVPARTLAAYECKTPVGDFIGLGFASFDGIHIAALRVGMDVEVAKRIDERLNWNEPFKVLHTVLPAGANCLTVSYTHKSAILFMQSIDNAMQNDPFLSGVAKEFVIQEYAFAQLIRSWQPEWRLSQTFEGYDPEQRERPYVLQINGYTVKIAPHPTAKAIYRGKKYWVIWVIDDQVLTIDLTTDTGRYISAALDGALDLNTPTHNLDWTLIRSVLGRSVFDE